MTLRQKLIVLSVLSKGLMGAVLLLALPWAVKVLALRHTDSLLRAELNRVEGRIAQVGIEEFLPGAQTTRRAHYDLLQDEFIALRPLTGPQALHPDSVATVPHQRFEGPADFRVLHHEFAYRNQPYALEVGKSMASVEEVYDLLRSLARYALVFAVLSTLLLEFGVMNYLLRPVEAIVDRLRAVQGPLPPPLSPLETTTSDFRYLDLMLRRMLQRIRAGHEQERQFIAHASHELLTPIAVLQNRFENMLAAENLPEVAEAQLVASQKTLHRLTATLRTLLLISRIENEQYARAETVDINAVLDDVLAELEDLIVDRNLRVERHLTPLPLLGDANRTLLFTLLYNLVSNAIKYNEAGGRLGLATQRTDDGAYTLTVFNTGPPIPPEHLPRIFERFRRANPTAAEGHGLGLALARVIAHFHGMRLRLESGAEGTTAILRWQEQVR